MDNWKISFFFGLGALIGIIFTAVLMVNLTPEVVVQNPRMMIVEKFSDEGYHFDVWVDTETRVQYLTISSGGIAVMLDADGNPLLYEVK